MLILCSDGLTNPKLLEQLSSMVSNCISAAIVVTADPVYKERNYHVPRCRSTLESLGLEVTILDLDIHPVEQLLSFDVVEFIGGNPFYLLNAIRSHHAETVLKDIAENKILIGWSAAAFVFGPSLELVNRYSPEMNDLHLTDLTGLSLTNIEVLPHYSKFLTKFDHFEETCKTYEEEKNITVLRLNDGDGVLLQHNNVEIVRHAKSN